MDGINKPYVLVYFIDDYPESGGGLYFERFETIDQLDQRVQIIYNTCEIKLTGLVKEISYEEVEIVTKIKRVE